MRLLLLHDDGCILDYTFCFLSGALPTLCNRGRMFIVVFQYYDYNFSFFFQTNMILICITRMMVGSILDVNFFHFGGKCYTPRSAGYFVFLFNHFHVCFI